MTVNLKLPQCRLRGLGVPGHTVYTWLQLVLPALRRNPNSPWRTTTPHGENRSWKVFLPLLQLEMPDVQRWIPLCAWRCIQCHDPPVATATDWLTSETRHFCPCSLPWLPASRRYSLWQPWKKWNTSLFWERTQAFQRESFLKRCYS
jgi:hypothetical protein